MNETVRDRLAVLNAFVHDVATGTWLASLLLVTLVESRERHPELAAGAAPVLAALQRETMVLTWASLGVILATGVVRLVTWKAFGWTGDVSRDRIRLLKVKHAVLGVAFAAGTAWMAAIVYFG